MTLCHALGLYNNFIGSKATTHVANPKQIKILRSCYLPIRQLVKKIGVKFSLKLYHLIFADGIQMNWKY